MKVLLRGTLATLLGSVTLLFASAALAEGEPCYNDDDCPNPACGGDVCNWAKTAAKPDGRKFFYCQAAGLEPKGTDGWCESEANCKCKATGATCNTSVSHCTDTGTPAASGGAPSGGSAAGGSAAGGSPSAGSSVGGASSTAGAPSSSAGTGTAPTTPASSDSGGCSVSTPGNAGSAALLLGVAGLGLAVARRRR